MNIVIHNINNTSIAELVSNNVEINNVQDALDLMGNTNYQGANKIIVKENNLCPEFFDLKTKIAGEILQKFSNYRMQLAIIGDFQKFTSRSLNNFIYESNKSGQIVFTESFDQATKILAGTP